MDNNAEYQFITMQLNANSYVKGVMEADITKLLQLVHEKRNVLKEIEDIDRELKFKLDAIKAENNWIVLYNPVDKTK